MQNRNFNDPELYDEMGYNKRPGMSGNGNEGYYNPLPTERDTYENRHHNRPYQGNHPSESGFRQPESGFGYPHNYQNHSSNPVNSAYNRALLDRFGNGRRGESIARGNYGIPGSDRFGNVWYHDPRNQGYGSHYGNEYHERGLAEQFGDEVRSWFGNKEAARRREQDSRHAIGGRQGEWPEANRHYDDEVDRDLNRRNYPGYNNRW